MLMHQKDFDLLFAALAPWNPAYRSQYKGKEHTGEATRRLEFEGTPGSSQSPRSQR